MMRAAEHMLPDIPIGPRSGNQDPLLREVVKLNSIMIGIVAGMTAGLVLFIATMWLVLKGGPMMGQHLSLLSQFFPGYRVSFLGSFIGLAYGFVTGFLIGVIVGRLYNSIVRLTER